MTSTLLWAQDTAGKYPFTSTRALAKEDIEEKSQQELKIMRNEIFARHGHTFKSEDLKRYFASQSWYTASTADASPLLTPLEKQNADFIKKWETRITNTSDFDTFFEIFSNAIEQDDVNKLIELVLIGTDSYFTSADEFKKRYAIEKAQLNLEPFGTPRDLGDEKRLYYGEFYSQVQYQFVIFKKVGCCWYIEALQKAG
ncbi:MAG TPA: YARHG domain-containing protein [Chryseolinea sp.]|nr:YARHG domain-containing protein [Chryseolinea sp.]HPM29067.1 YARHG domain-containing protein [Chryseolinea sp.]